MGARDKRLAELRRVVVSQLAREGGRSPLAVTRPDGSRPLVFALEDERFNVLMQRVNQAGGVANVFVAMNDNTIVPLNAWERPKDGRAVTDLGEVKASISIGMFLATLRTTENGGATVSVALPNDSVLDVAELVGAGSWS